MLGIWICRTLHAIIERFNQGYFINQRLTIMKIIIDFIYCVFYNNLFFFFYNYTMIYIHVILSISYIIFHHITAFVQQFLNVLICWIMIDKTRICFIFAMSSFTKLNFIFWRTMKNLVYNSDKEFRSVKSISTSVAI